MTRNQVQIQTHLCQGVLHQESLSIACHDVTLMVLQAGDAATHWRRTGSEERAGGLLHPPNT